MRGERAWLLPLVALAASSAQASVACKLPQLGLTPGMNSTAVEEPLMLWLDGSAVTLRRAAAVTPPGEDPARYLWVEAEDGTRIAPHVEQVDGGPNRVGLRLSEFGSPGWYTVHFTLPPKGRESGDRSLVAGATGFWAELLIGRSEPGIASIEECQGGLYRFQTVELRWSEPVQFVVDPVRDIELLGAEGTMLPCVDRLAAADAGYDGGLRSSLSLDCGEVDVRSVRVVRAPHGRDGGVATFPPEDELWELTTWGPHVSLITHDQRDAQIQTQGRITLMGDAEVIADRSAIGARYLRYFPESESYFQMHDFTFYRIRPVALRYIGGFGRIHWVDSAKYNVPSYPLIEQEAGVVEHMNADHLDTMRHYCKFIHQRDVLDVKMLGIDCDGFDVSADGDTLRFDFPEPTLDAQQARAALVALARVSKQQPA